MKNLNQVQLIENALNKEREKLLMELSRINTYLNKKIESIKKVVAYQKEYAEGVHLNATRSIPMLHKNLDFFSNKMKDIIIVEEREIQKLKTIQQNKLKEIELIDNKVKLMSAFSESILSEMAVKLESAEQSGIDDLSATKQSRGDYE